MSGLQLLFVLYILGKKKKKMQAGLSQMATRNARDKCEAEAEVSHFENAYRQIKSFTNTVTLRDDGEPPFTGFVKIKKRGR